MFSFINIPLGSFGLIMVLFTCLFSIACTPHVTVQLETHLPTPVVDTIPVTIGIIYDKTLTNFVKNETLPISNTKWTIKLEDKQKEAFAKIIQAMFAEVITITDKDFPNQRLSGVLRPVLQKFQFSTPKQTRGDFFEVWFQYRIQLLDYNGKELTSWLITAYGKSEETFLKNASSGIQQAADRALRDLIAVFIYDFKKQPKVVSWLQSIQKQ